ncbi:MAG: peptidoglycan-binding protein [Patescibacteria group bacterium]|nr:peptidoglycan-binding protein [Patescibacteria group bacterium]
MINGCRIEGRLNMFAIRERELGIPESSPVASPVPLQPEPEFDLGSVSGIQKALNRLGAQPLLKEDGVVGPKTKAAVMAFQGQHALKVDGIVGPNTLAALKAALEGVSK